MRITRGQFLRFAVVAVGTGGTAILACDGGSAATPGDDVPGGPLAGEDAGEAGGHRGPQRPDGSAQDASTTDADASDASDAGDAEGDADATNDAPIAVPSCEKNGANGGIGTNHGHSLTIDAGAFANIQGQQTFQLLLSHGGVFHTITLTDVEMNQLVAGAPVVTTSTAAGVDSHTHAVTLTCA